ncbi:hypothetical protein K4K59_009215 [Colletotrichum sp. SAR11_240]|nr:hypothetical protein K4K59_009215 [Colletotrichum sp. SAR11_240]
MCLTNSPTTVCQQPLDNFRGSRTKARAGIPFCVSIKAVILSHLAQSGVMPESLPPGNNFTFLPSLRRACNLDHGPEFVAAINDRFVSLIRCLLKLATRRNLISNEHWIEWTWNGPPALEGWLRSQCSMKDHWEMPLEQMMGSLSLASPSPSDAVLDDLAAPKQARNGHALPRGADTSANPAKFLRVGRDGRVGRPKRSKRQHNVRRS